jgi:ATP-dependent RNA helicase SUPV3L1/SUV3
MKTLDQTARAALRRLGVRFGFYNVFLPALIKPAPAEALTLLWSLKHDLIGQKGYGEVVGLLAAGRTSFAPDPTIDTVFYRLAGFAVAGPRAVRFDILERLADQIRPALFWKEGVEVRPDAGFGKGAFFVTPGMLSILGATHDDMAAVLSGLGYRSQPMPKAEFDAKLEAVKLIVPAQAAAAAQPKFEVVITGQHRVETPNADSPLADAAQADNAAQADDTTVEAPGAEIAAEAMSDAAALPEAAADVVVPEALTVPSEPAVEAKPVLIWRQARPDQQRPDQHRPDQRRPARRRAAAAGEAGAAGDAQADARPAGGRPRGGRPHDGKPHDGKPWQKREDGGNPAAKPKFDRSRFEKPKGDSAQPQDGAASQPDTGSMRGAKGKFDKPRYDKPKSDKPKFDKPRFDAPKPEKPKYEKPIDPDSPFAKLAALKERMKG